MSSTDSSSDDHAYFQAIEEVFIRLRGAPLLLSPADWQLAKRWHQQGIPAGLVQETLEEVFALRATRGSKGKVQGLRYCAVAVEKAWSEHQELVATGGRRESTSIDLPARLRRLSKSLAACHPVAEDLADRIVALQGTPEFVEDSLASLDREMIDSVSASLDEGVRREIESSLVVSLNKLQSRLDEAEARGVRDRLWREAVRRRLELPVLSLFSADSLEDRS